MCFFPKIRLRMVWIFLFPFYFLAAPTPTGMALGIVLGILGLVLRGWAAGSIWKNQELAMGGPYGYTRNPLYAGSFLLGVGLAVAAARWFFPVVLVAFFLSIYRTAALREALELEALFGESYRIYATAVPLFLPRLSAFRTGREGQGSPGFSLTRYQRNREWEAVLGGLAGFGLLALKMILWG